MTRRALIAGNWKMHMTAAEAEALAAQVAEAAEGATDRDVLVAPPFTWEPYRVKIPNMTIRVFEKSGHTPQYEEPKAFDRVLIEWLRKSEQ